VSPRVLPKCSRSALEVDLGSWVSIAFADEKAEKLKPVEVSHAPLEVELAVLSKYSRSALEVCFEVADWLLEWLAGWFVRSALVAHAMNLLSRANVCFQWGTLGNDERFEANVPITSHYHSDVTICFVIW
jgi:hypothetical protein